MSLLIVKTGSTRPEIAARFGDYDEWFIEGLGIGRDALSVVDARTEVLPRDVDAVVVTGSPCNVTERAAWSETTARWLAEQVGRDVPVLGVCFGHQLLAHALGGRVEYNPRGEELGTVTVRLLAAAVADPLLGGLPEEFSTHTTHSQSVVELPSGATLLATNDFDANQAYRVGPCAWGVQFHPEFTTAIMRDHVERRRTRLQEQGRDPDGIIDAIVASPAEEVLRAFAARFIVSPVAR